MVSRVGHGTPRFGYLRISVLTHRASVIAEALFLLPKNFQKMFDIGYIQVYTIDMERKENRLPPLMSWNNGK